MNAQRHVEPGDVTYRPSATIVGNRDEDPLARLLNSVEALRLSLNRSTDARHRAELSQFLTPTPVAAMMASMFAPRGVPSLHLLDAGAGIGTLSAAWISAVCEWTERPAEITITAYELDDALLPYLHDTLLRCAKLCERAGIVLHIDVRQEDFIRAGVRMAHDGFFAPSHERFDHVILNPPYCKIRGDSEARRLLRSIGIETSNLYTGFLALAVQLLKPGGELVAITPRSFCNGPYFRAFRQQFLREMSLGRVHLFDSRDRTFQDDDVLQETIIVHAVKEPVRAPSILISSNAGPDDPDMRLQETPFERIVYPGDPDQTIHLALDELDHLIVERMAQWNTSLSSLSLTVSTGRVVDFRARPYLRDLPESGTVPLIYPEHCVNGSVSWPKQKSRKPQAIVAAAETENLLVPSETYVLVKRFTAKEERRRIVATLYDPAHIDAPCVGFENHLNYYHRQGRGLPIALARGLAAYLNSSVVDAHFRQFSGHTQVNATDLRKLCYPTREELVALGGRVGATIPPQNELDRLINEELLRMPDDTVDPIEAARKIGDAKKILRALEMPRAQQNERSALTLLALLDLKPGTPWTEASDPLCGITPMMEFFRDQYGKVYAPNTRETVRRFTIHQFLEAGLVIANPARPDRPVNSPETVYQIGPDALDLLRTFSTEEWTSSLGTYLESRQTLKDRYARERVMARIPVTLSSGETLTLSSGGQNVLIKQVIETFCPLFTPGATILYVGDTGEKFGYFDRDALQALGVTIEEHGKMPDVIIQHAAKNWLVLIEAVTSHGPVNPKRRGELSVLFGRSTAPLVYVTAFLSRKAMMRYLSDISWETEVWIAESPTHMIHFNGERFLGPR